MFIPDYLIIDEISRREDGRRGRHGEVPLPLPQPGYDVPDDSTEYPSRQWPPKKPHQGPARQNGAIIINL